MNHRLKPFTPRTLALLVAAAFAGHVNANTGRVEFVFGGATLRNAQGDQPLTRGADLRTGDAVLTTDGRAQIRFSDGSFVSLQPNTEFKIDEYRFDGQADGSESGIFALAKGAMRTVTGLVGRVNRSKYQVRTPTATVGIRGTGGIISVLLDGSTLVRGTTGIWTLTNLGGASLDIPAGRAGLAGNDKSQPPRESSQAPSAPPAPPTVQTPNPPISLAENRNSDGISGIITSALQDTGKPIGVVNTEVFGGSLNIGLFFVPDIPGAAITVKGDIGPAGQLSGFTFRETATGDGFRFAFTGTLNESGSDGTVSWGRWTGPVTFTSVTGGASESGTAFSYGPNGGFHFAIGVPTAQMPTTGTFSYDMIGATAVTHQLETMSPGIVTSASFKGAFTPTGGNVGLDVFYTIGGANWHLNSPGGSCTPSISIAGNTFTGSGSNQRLNCGPCQTSCAAQITGGFAGVGATHAGVAYKGQIVPGADNHVGGIVVFRKAGGGI